MPLPDDMVKLNKEIGLGGGASSSGDDTSAEDRSEGGGIGSYVKGIGQGLLDLPEGAAQLAEKGIQQIAPNFRIVPQGLRDWAREYRRDVESTTAGQLGEFTGGIAPALIPFLGEAAAGARATSWLGRLAEAAGAGARGTRGAAARIATPEASAAASDLASGVKGTRIGRAVSRTFERNPAFGYAVKSGAGAAIGAPVSGDDNFATEKMNQIATGMALGGLAARATGAGRTVPRRFTVDSRGNVATTRLSEAAEERVRRRTTREDRRREAAQQRGEPWTGGRDSNVRIHPTVARFMGRAAAFAAAHHMPFHVPWVGRRTMEHFAANFAEKMAREGMSRQEIRYHLSRFFGTQTNPYLVGAATDQLYSPLSDTQALDQTNAEDDATPTIE
jgi:hypothetical protein